MRFRELSLSGAFTIDLERFEDERGYFARTFCKKEFEEHGLLGVFPQCNTSFNAKRGTLRGMHYQIAPHEEVKLVRCTRGAVLDVIIDLRPDSKTFQKWEAAELTAENGRALYIPKGFAHGFQTLEDNSEVFYLMGESYHPESARGVRYNDPAFDIRWPIASPIIADRDASYPDFKP